MPGSRKEREYLAQATAARRPDLTVVLERMRRPADPAQLAAAAERHAASSAALDAWAAEAGGRFDDALFAPAPEPFYGAPAMPAPGAQAAQDAPATLPLPPQVTAGLQAPSRGCEGLPPKGPGWADLEQPFLTPEQLTALPQMALALMQEMVAAHGEAVLNVAVAYKCRRVAHLLLTGQDRPAEGRA